MMPTFPVLGGVTALYALFLDRTRKLWDPGLTWLTVVIGTVLCVGAAHIETNKQDDATWQDYERNVVTAFLWGGASMIIWRLLRSRRFGLGLGTKENG